MTRAASTIGLVGLALLVACDTPSEEDALIEALPDQALLDISLPGDDEVIGALSVIEAPLLGQRSGLRDLTRGVKTFLTVTISHLLEHIERVTATRPFREDTDRTLWRLPAPGGEREYGVMLSRTDSGQVAISGWLRPIRERDVPWRFLFAGTMQKDGSVMRGALHVDLDNDLNLRSRGRMLVLWSLVEGRRHIEVVLFDGTPDDGSVGRLTRTFRYEQTADGGLLSFDAGEQNVHLTADHQGLERVRVATRWNKAGQFRSDYAAVGPEVKRDGFRALLGSECWRAPDATVQYEQRLAISLATDTAIPLFDRGDPTACPDPDQKVPFVPTVAAPGNAPTDPARPSAIDLLPTD